MNGVLESTISPRVDGWDALGEKMDLKGKIRTIRSEADYKAVLARIEEIFNAKPGTPDGEELDRLVTLVERYEMRGEESG